MGKSMTDLAVNIVKSRGFWFLVFGGFIFVAQIISLRYVVESFGAEKRIMNPIIDIIGMEVSFVLNKYINWRDRQGTFVSHWKKFHHVRLGTYLVNQILFIFLVPFGVPYVGLKTGLSALEVGVHFFFNDRYAFKGPVQG